MFILRCPVYGMILINSVMMGMGRLGSDTCMYVSQESQLLKGVFFGVFGKQIIAR